MEEKKQRDWRAVAYRVLLVILACLFLFSGWKLGGMLIEYYKNDKGFSDLAQEMVSTPAPTAEPDPGAGEEEEAKERAPILVNMDALLERNEDTVAWLYCEDTPIDFAITQSSNNSTYMGWNFDKQRSDYGWPFMDYRCKGDFSGYCSTIYGHNMQNGSVFAVLEKYQKQEFYEEHPVMWLITPEGSYKVRLMAGVFLYGVEEAYGGFGENEEHFRAFLKDVEAASTFQSDVEVEDVERVLMLSTCSNVRTDMRFAVIGAMEKIDE